MPDPDEELHQATMSLVSLAEEVERERAVKGRSALDVTVSPEDEEEVSER